MRPLTFFFTPWMTPSSRRLEPKYLALIKSGLDIPNLLSEAGLADRKILLHILSRYEFIATGVREGAFDAKIYKRMYYTNVIADWDKLETFVRELRINRNNNTPFQELERLVRNWKKHPLKAYKNPTPRKNAPPRRFALNITGKPSARTASSRKPVPASFCGSAFELPMIA